MTDNNDSQLDQYWEALQQNQFAKAAQMRQQITDADDSDDKAMRLLDALNDARLLIYENGAVANTESNAETGKQDQTNPETYDENQFHAGNQIGDYVLLEKIAEGGMGVVFVARQCSLQRNVALKLIKSGRLTNAEDLKRFKIESLIGSQLKHPGVVQIYENGVIDRIPYFSMELIDGKDLSQLLKLHPLDPDTAARYVQGICNAVHAAHQHSILHRDLKPSNVLIDSYDAPRITDFGLAKWLESESGPDAPRHSLTMSGTTIGTPSYMSPEQALGLNKAICRASDVYSIGAILYECITGRPPFRADTPIETLRQVVDADPALPRAINRNIPRDLETICLKALQKNPDRRYSTADDFAADLGRYLKQQPIQARPVSKTTRLLLWCSRNRALAASLTMLLLSLLVGSVVSTAMWIKSEQNLALQKQTAADLNVSRTRLRESVSEFQAKVFSSESLHWQMSGQFRKDMFRNVIEFLDEFARLDDVTQSTTGNGQKIANDYLNIAEVALEVGNFDEAELASSRALQRINKRLADGNTQADNLLLKSKSQRLLFISREANSRGMHESLDILNESLESAREASRKLVDDVGSFINLKETEYQILLREHDADNHPQMNQLVEELSRYLERHKSRFQETDDAREFNHQRAAILDLLIRVQMSMLQTVPDDNLAFFADQLYFTEIDRLREAYRMLSQPMTKTDRMRAKISQAMAQRIWLEGNTKEAIEKIEDAIAKYEEALKPNPQNRIWRLDLSNCLKKASSFCQSLHDQSPQENVKSLEMAREKTNRAIQNYMYILETDANDDSTRLLGIEQFTRYAILSRDLQQHFQAYRGFYTAAQELNLIMLDDYSPRFFEIRVQLLASAFQHLQLSENNAQYQSQLDIQSELLKRQADVVNSKRPASEHVDLDHALKTIRGQVEIETTALENLDLLQSGTATAS